MGAEIAITIISVISSIVFVASLVSNIIMHRKIVKYENELYNIQSELIKIMVNINEIDKGGIFSGDDEVCISFTQIKDTINLLQKFVVVDDNTNTPVQ